MDREPAARRGEETPVRVRGGCPGNRAPPVGRHDQSETPHRGRGGRGRLAIRVLSEAQDAAVSHRRRHAGVGGRAAEVPLPGFAPAAPAVQSRTSSPRHDGDPAVLRRPRILGNRDADPDQVDARGSARLPGAEPGAPRRVLRAAAVAADLQADPDDRRHRPVLPDRQVLPRRGSPRRPAARVHAGRRRDVVRAAGPGVRADRATDPGDLPGDWRRRPDALPPDAVRRGAGEVRLRQARPALRARDRRRLATSGRRRRSMRSAASSRRAASCARSWCPARREVLAIGARRPRRTGQAARRGRHPLGAPQRRGRSTRTSRRPARAAPAPSMEHAGCGPRGFDSAFGRGADSASKLLGAFRLSLARKENLIPADTYEFAWVVDFPLLDWDADEKRWVSMHHPFTSPLDEDFAGSTPNPGPRARQGVRPGAERQRDWRRQHPDPRFASVQSRIFQLLNLSDEDAKLRFGFFVEALEYGTPAAWRDRASASTVCARSSPGRARSARSSRFPKTATAVDLMSGAPSPVDDKQLRELKLKLAASRT